MILGDGLNRRVTIVHSTSRLRDSIKRKSFAGRKTINLKLNSAMHTAYSVASVILYQMFKDIRQDQSSCGSWYTSRDICEFLNLLDLFPIIISKPMHKLN